MAGTWPESPSLSCLVSSFQPVSTRGVRSKTSTRFSWIETPGNSLNFRLRPTPQRSISSSSWRRGVHLSTEVLVGQITAVAELSDGRLLVVDRIGRQVLLYSARGQLLRKVTPEDCVPGTSWQPVDVSVRSDDSFVVINRPRGVFSFSEDGSCGEDWIPDFMPRRFPVVQDGLIWGGRQTWDYHEIEAVDQTGVVVDRRLRSTAYRLLISRFGAGGLVVEGDESLMVAYPFSPLVYRVSLKRPGAPPIPLGFRPSYYRPIDTDLTAEQNSDGRSAMAAVELVLSSYSITASLHKLDDNTLYVVYMNGFEEIDSPDRFGIHLMDYEGGPLALEGVVATVSTGLRLHGSGARLHFGARAGSFSSRIEPIACDLQVQ